MKPDSLLKACTCTLDCVLLTAWAQELLCAVGDGSCRGSYMVKVLKVSDHWLPSPKSTHPPKPRAWEHHGTRSGRTVRSKRMGKCTHCELLCLGMTWPCLS